MRTFTKTERQSARIELALSFKQGKVRLRTEEVTIKFSNLTSQETTQLLNILKKHGK